MAFKYPKRNWTPEEIQKLEDYAGIYNGVVIAKRLKRTPNSVYSKMKRLKIYAEEKQKAKGMLAADFSDLFGMPTQNVHHLVRRGILPRMKLPSYMCIGDKKPNWVLIDETKIEQWLLKGYVYHRDIKPLDPYYQRMVYNVRKKLDLEWISCTDVVECLGVTPKTIQAWYYRHKFPRFVFYSTQMSISMYNRNAVIEWCKNHPKQVNPMKIQELRMYGIGRGLS
jgi:hypothetical protein